MNGDGASETRVALHPNSKHQTGLLDWAGPENKMSLSKPFKWNSPLLLSLKRQHPWPWSGPERKKQTKGMCRMES